MRCDFNGYDLQSHFHFGNEGTDSEVGKEKNTTAGSFSTPFFSQSIAIISGS
jgi:hypothetical protein